METQRNPLPEGAARMMMQPTRSPMSLRRTRSLLAVCGILLLPASRSLAASSTASTSLLTQRVTFAPGDVAVQAAPAGQSGSVVTLRGAQPASEQGTPALPEYPLTLLIPGDRSVAGVRAVVEGESEVAQ